MAKATNQFRKHALSLPETEEGTSCHKAAFKAGKKNFFFLGEEDDGWDAKVKLGDSIPEAENMAAKQPSHYSVGGTGWVEVTFPNEKTPPKGLMERWITESYRMLVPKKLVALLPD